MWLKKKTFCYQCVGSLNDWPHQHNHIFNTSLWLNIGVIINSFSVLWIKATCRSFFFFLSEAGGWNKCWKPASSGSSLSCCWVHGKRLRSKKVSNEKPCVLFNTFSNVSNFSESKTLDPAFDLLHLLSSSFSVFIFTGVSSEDLTQVTKFKKYQSSAYSSVWLTPILFVGTEGDSFHTSP